MTCPKCAAPLQRVPLSGGLELETCPACSGVFYDGDEIAVDLAFENLAPGRGACPKCAAKLQSGTLYNGRLSLERCPGCGGLWFDAGEVQVLRMLSGAEGLLKRKDEPRPAPGPAPAAAGMAGDPSVDTGRPERRVPQTREVRVFVPDSAEQNNPDEYANPVAHWEGLGYEHFQTSWPVVTFVLGEFPWRVSVGEKGKARDFVHPPHLLSEDSADGESNWSHGTYLEPEEVWAAFKRPGSPPPRSGVAPAQPNPHKDALAAMKPAFVYALVACVSIFALALLFSQRRHVYGRSFSHPTMSPEKSFVTETFRLEGRTSNLRLSIDTNIDNGWAEFSMALINEDTGDALDFARGVSYYSGIDGGERWSEGSRKDRSFIPSVPPGTYYLRVEIDGEGRPFSYTLNLHRDVPQWSLLFWALLLLSAPFALSWLRWWLFESSRWQESDHPWVSHDGEDDDE